MWLGGLAVLPNLHAAKIHETLCTSEAGDAWSLPQSGGDLLCPVSLQVVTPLEEGTVRVLKDLTMSTLTSPTGFPVPIKRDLDCAIM